MVKPWNLPGWVVSRGAELDLDLDQQAARALVAHVGDRQQRLLRELEKLALEHGAGAHLGVEEVEASCASSAERKSWDLADASSPATRSARSASCSSSASRGADPRPALPARPQAARRPGIAEGLEAGRPAAQVKKGLRMSPKAADRFVAEVGRRDVDAFRRALVVMADLELESRGGGGDRVVAEDTAAVRAVIAAAG